MIYRINEEFFQVELYRETTDTEPCEVIELDVAIHAYHDWQKIVRCKECKWYDADTDWANIPYCDKHHIEAYEDGFCSYGEREGE